MTMPGGIGAVDLMIGFPTSDFTRHYDNLRALAKDAESKEFEFPAQYLFADAADRYRGDVDPIEATLAEMDRFGVAAGMIGDPDPYTATMNALQFFRVDDIVISTLPATRSGWLRADLIERVRRATAKPVEHVEANAPVEA